MEQTSREPLPGIVRALSVGMAAVALGACVTTVEPPLTAGDAVDVYLLDHGRTPSLVLPTGTGELTRYAYGDWRWYALGERGVPEGAAALLWPTPAALGRQALGGPREASTVRRQVFVEIEELHAIRVGRRQAAALAARLDALFARALATLVQNEETGLRALPLLPQLESRGGVVAARARLPRARRAAAGAVAGEAGRSAPPRAPLTTLFAVSNRSIDSFGIAFDSAPFPR